jgi:hypothetical protein
VLVEVLVDVLVTTLVDALAGVVIVAGCEGTRAAGKEKCRWR